MKTFTSKLIPALLAAMSLFSACQISTEQRLTPATISVAPTPVGPSTPQPASPAATATSAPTHTPDATATPKPSATWLPPAMSGHPAKQALAGNPLPPGSPCKAYSLGDSRSGRDLTDLSIAADGRLWAATWGQGVARYAPEQDEWYWYTEADGLVSNYVNSIAAEPAGRLWFATDRGAAAFDGSQWSRYTAQDGLADEWLTRVAIDKAGTAWFAGPAGFFRYDLTTGQWRNYTATIDLPDDRIESAILASDGTAWVMTSQGTPYRLDLPQGPGGPASWQRAVEPDGYFPVSDITGIAIAPDGRVWFSGSNGLARLDPKTQKVTRLGEAPASDAAIQMMDTMDIAADGSVWIGMGYSRPRLLHFVLDSPAGNQGRWREYTDLPSTPSRSEFGDGVRAIAVAPNGEVWIGTPQYVLRCKFAESQQPENGPLPTASAAVTPAATPVQSIPPTITVPITPTTGARSNLPDQAVYEALFGPDARLLVLGAETDYGSPTGMGGYSGGAVSGGGSLKELPGLSDETYNNFIRLNQYPSVLEDFFKPEIPHVFITSEASRAFFSDREQDGWKKFYEQYPDAGGMTNLSRVGFNAAGDQALVYIGSQSGWVSGAGYLVLLEKENGKWVVKGSTMIWIS